MSMIMTLSVKGDPRKLEEYAAANQDAMKTIVESAAGHGMIAHRFYGSEGEIMVIDEWPDEQSFRAFFAENDSRIGPMMQAAGVTSEPEIRVWNKLDTHDDYGWGA